jgi:hypothetical protein
MEAQRLYDLTRREAARLGLDMLICKGMNHGALIERKTFVAAR